METIKCKSCGAYQSLSGKCEYCGVKLHITEENKEVSNEDLKSFKLAFFEFNNKNYSKSSLLFDELIKKDSELFIAWVYKVMGDFLNTFSYRVDFDILSKNIKFLIENSKNESNLRFLEEKLIFLIEKIYLDEYFDRGLSYHYCKINNFPHNLKLIYENLLHLQISKRLILKYQNLQCQSNNQNQRCYHVQLLCCAHVFYNLTNEKVESIH